MHVSWIAAPRAMWASSLSSKKYGRRYNVPRTSCSRSIASDSALKVPLAEALRTLALDDLEEQRGVMLHRLREERIPLCGPWVPPLFWSTRQ